MQSGKVTPVIDRPYKSLGDVKDALEYSKKAMLAGKWSSLSNNMNRV